MKVRVLDVLSRGHSGESSIATTAVLDAIVPAYEMYVMPCSELLCLDTLLPHQQLLKAGRVITVRAARRLNGGKQPTILFVSHQWTAFREPDHTGMQLRTLQNFLSQMLEGTLPELSSELLGSIGEAAGKSQKISKKDWIELARNAFIWIDFQSIPQPYYETDDHLRMVAAEQMKLAVDSIPAYVRQALVFLVVCPPVPHRDVPGAVCDEASWLDRAWCRLESLTLLMQERSVIPALIVKSLNAEPCPLDSHLIQPPGTGHLTCCRIKHEVVDSNGSKRSIPCDKQSLARVIDAMLRYRIAYHATRNDVHELRMWISFGRYYARGLDMHYDPLLPDKSVYEQQQCGDGEQGPVQARLLCFLRHLRFLGPLDAAASVSPLLCAACAGEPTLVRSLIDARANVGAQGYAGKQLTTFHLMRGITPLHYAVTIAEDAHCIALLLESRADPHATAGKPGLTPMACAAAIGAQKGIQAFAAACTQLNIELDIDRGVPSIRASPLYVAAYTGTPGSVLALLELGANPRVVNDHGVSVLCAACTNPRMDTETLELLITQGAKSDINRAAKPRRIKWQLAALAYESAVKIQSDRGRKVVQVANGRNSTALHQAAAIGRLDMVKLLLKHGAEPSLAMRNRVGNTPLHMARKFGPFPHVEAELENAERRCTRTSVRSRFKATSRAFVERGESSHSVWSTGPGNVASSEIRKRRANLPAALISGSKAHMVANALLGLEDSESCNNLSSPLKLRAHSSISDARVSDRLSERHRAVTQRPSSEFDLYLRASNSSVSSASNHLKSRQTNVAFNTSQNFQSRAPPSPSGHTGLNTFSATANKNTNDADDNATASAAANSDSLPFAASRLLLPILRNRSSMPSSPMLNHGSPIRSTAVSGSSARSSPKRARRSHDSVVFVMRVTDVLALHGWESFAELRKKGTVVEYDSGSMGALLYVSQEHTSFCEADHTTRRLAVLRQTLLKLREGDAHHHTAASPVQRVFGRRSAKLRAQDWGPLLQDAVVWSSSFSVPPASLEEPDEEEDRDGAGLDEAARSSVSYYVAALQLAHAFLVLCPTVKHRELGRVCDEASWHESGLARFELLAAALRGISSMVCKGSSLDPQQLPVNVMLPPGLGAFQCCSANHSCRCHSRVMACMRKGVAQALHYLLKRWVAALLECKQLDAYRMWRALSTYYLRSMVDDAEAHVLGFSSLRRMDSFKLDVPGYDDNTAPPSKLASFLREGHFQDVNDTGRRSRHVSPLLCAACAQDAMLVDLLLEAKADANNRFAGEPMPELLLMKGVTPLHYAVAVAESVQMISSLLKSGAHPYPPAGPVHIPPIVYAAALGAANGIRAFASACAERSITLDIDRGLPVAGGVSPLSIAAFTGTPAAVATLIELSANVHHISDDGGTILWYACRNPLMDIPTLELLWSMGIADQISKLTCPRTKRWRSISFVSETIYRLRRDPSRTIISLANSRSSTPLHQAAAIGRLDMVQWLLARGAGASLTVQNKVGNNPLQLARRCGPFPHVQVELEQALARELRTSSNSQRKSAAAVVKLLVEKSNRVRKSRSLPGNETERSA